MVPPASFYESLPDETEAHIEKEALKSFELRTAYLVLEDNLSF